jgi:hypothetical protein
VIAAAWLLAAQALAGQIASAAGAAPGWVAYRVPLAEERAHGPRVCCAQGLDGPCRLAGSDGVTMTVAVEPSAELLVFAHVDHGAVDRLRTFTPDCGVDTAGEPVEWLRDVAPDESARWLASLAGADGRESRVAGPAMAALALEAGGGSVDALVRLARDNPSARVRGSALFWLAQRASAVAAAAITDAIARDPDTAVRKRAVFALSQLPKDEGVPLLIQVARSNRDPAVRRQAMFWLGESKDPRAVSFFEQILKAGR